MAMVNTAPERWTERECEHLGGSLEGQTKGEHHWLRVSVSLLPTASLTSVISFQDVPASISTSSMIAPNASPLPTQTPHSSPPTFANSLPPSPSIHSTTVPAHLVRSTISRRTRPRPTDVTDGWRERIRPADRGFLDALDAGGW